MARQIKYSNIRDLDFPISYKAPWGLSRFLTKHFSIKARFQTGVSNKLHRQIEKQVKKARVLALLPFVDHHAIK